MTSRDDESVLRDLTARDRSPVIPALVYPPHVFYVPPQLFMGNLLFSVLAFVLFGTPLAMLASGVAVHVILAVLYLREPYMVGVAHAWWQARLWPAFRRTRNRVRYPAGNKFVA